ncbi:hypothetical protein FE844_002950 [Rhizobium indicum]|uniref:hypothetical protein n=1 Tax=Rhizobium indicum TaxID=2583231 RepID=UPI0011069D8C|nr:hypothetical protein [Rhizobium indicum]QKK28595.1 hypothetical protein FE844_002950 [Rhizobium indicum]
MPNTSVPAAAEGLAKISSQQKAVQEPETPQDQLLVLVGAYRAGMREFARLPDFATREEEDAAEERTFAPHSRALRDWTGPAISKQGAVEALKLMIEEDMFNDMAGKPLARAVIAFLEDREEPEPLPETMQATRRDEQAAQPMTHGDLENPICELVSMARIADEILDQVFEAAPPKGRLITVSLSRDQIDTYSFAYKNVLDRAIDLKQAFYAIPFGG